MASTSANTILYKMSDAQLVNELLNDNNDAIAVLFDRYQRLAFKIAWNFVRENGEAEEIVIQTFLDLFRAIKQFCPVQGNFKTWMLIYVHRRSFNRRQQLESGTACAEKPSNTEFSDMQCALRLLPLVNNALSKLQRKQRKTIELLFTEGMTINEISDRLRENTSEIRKNLYQGLKALDQTLRTHASAETNTIFKGPNQLEKILAKI